MDSNIPTIAPALLGADPLALADAIDQVEGAQIDTLHLDIMDGHFVRQISFGLRTVQAIRQRTGVPLDVHLQVERPEQYFDELIDAAVGAISVHVETTQHVAAILRRLDSTSVKRGVALNPGTPLGVLDEVLEQVDQVILMTSSPGTSDFLPYVLRKIRRLRAVLSERGIEHVRLVADGGVTAHVVSALVDAGADTLVAASAVFRFPGGAAAGVRALRLAADQENVDIARTGAP